MLGEWNNSGWLSGIVTVFTLVVRLAKTVRSGPYLRRKKWRQLEHDLCSNVTHIAVVVLMIN